MDIERNKMTARRLYELLNHGDAAAIGDLVAPATRSMTRCPARARAGKARSTASP